jgi:hypothetical protein
MDTQVLHMNTVKIKVPYDVVHSARLDLRRWKIRHYPFRRQNGGMEIEIFHNPKVSMFMLKYPNIVDNTN